MVFHIFQDMVGQWRWYLSAPNGIKLATSPQGYARREDCLSALDRVRDAAESPLVYDNFGPVASLQSAIVAHAV
jgi:uncharacterized protein YegP (UPF0339 family)